MTHTSNMARAGVQRALQAARVHLGVDVAFVSRLRDGRRTFVYVDADGEQCPVEAGASDPDDESYCHYVVRGEMPALLRDPSSHPIASQMVATHQLPVGTHVSVPIELADGTTYGTFCCFAYEVTDEIDERDVAGVRMLARVVAGYLDEEERVRREADQRRERLRAIAASSDVEVVFQPVVRLADQQQVAYEALARFPRLGQGPGEVFADAWRLNIGVEVEMAAIRAALNHVTSLPADASLSVNAAPATLVSDAFYRAITTADVDPSRLIVEVTEHAAVEDYPDLRSAVDRLAALGVRLAIDDVGAGFAGLNQIVHLSPDIIKIDAQLVRDVDQSVVKRAVVSALVALARETDIVVIAEGIETEAELDTLARLDVELGQGYHLSRPHELRELLATSNGAATAAGKTADRHAYVNAHT